MRRVQIEQDVDAGVGRRLPQLDVLSLRRTVCGVVTAPDGLLRVTVATARENLATALGVDPGVLSDVSDVVDELLQGEAMRTLELRGRGRLLDPRVDPLRCRACVFCVEKKLHVFSQCLRAARPGQPWCGQHLRQCTSGYLRSC